MKQIFKHALVALDQSDASDIIVNCLNHFRQFGTQKFTLFTSLSDSYPGGLDSENRRKRYQDQLLEFKRKLEPFDIEVDTDVWMKPNAYAPTQILKAAKEYGTGYIIIANRGFNRLREFLLGSTATELLQRCDLPVYLINLSVTDDKDAEARKLYSAISCRDSLQHILHPTDFSPTANRAFEVLLQLSKGKSDKITLLHVQASGRPGVDDPEQLREFDKKDRKTLTGLKMNLQESGISNIDIRIEHGSPVRQILDTAEASGASMLILGSQGRGYVSDLFLGGVSLQVIRKSSIPVLTIPAKRD
ncbi:MAG: universal stress protein [Balneolaceae bacterium]|nr:universal stress protein [Balneolaceae bacterium]